MPIGHTPIELAAAVGKRLSLNGGELTGPLLLHADPEVDLQAVTKQYVDGLIDDTLAELDDYLPLAGGTMLGDLILDHDPVQDLEAATKQYVDDTVANVPTGEPQERRTYGYQSTVIGSSIIGVLGGVIISTTGTAGNAADENGNFIALTCAASNGARALFTQAGTALGQFRWRPQATWFARTPANLANMLLWYGLNVPSNAAATPPGDGSCGFRFASSVGSTWYVYHNSTAVDTGVEVTTVTPYILSLDHRDPSRIDFYINGDLVHTATTDLPTGSEIYHLEAQVATTEGVLKTVLLSKAVVTMD